MALIVQKFGGTSVGDTDRIRAVAKRVVEAHKRGDDLVVVVSAMAGETDRLAALAKATSPDPDPREFDVLLSTGEQQTIALLAMAIRALGVSARSYTGLQIGMRTDGAHGRARILGIDATRMQRDLARGAIIVAAGFQGTDEDGNITTLGRGGSDTSAVALAAALDAEVCEIYTDVPGIFTADPNVVADARKLGYIAYDEMLEMASLGAKVLQLRAVSFGSQHGVRIHVRSTFEREEGTWVVPEEEVMERPVVSGVTYNRNEAKVTISRVPDTPGVVARIFEPLSLAEIVVDMIVQNVSADGHTDVTFTVRRSDLATALEIAERCGSELGAAGVQADDSIAKVSVIGLGMRDHAGVAGRMFSALADAGVNIQMISTSEIKVSVVIEERYAELACRTLHDAFELGEEQEPSAE